MVMQHQFNGLCEVFMQYIAYKDLHARVSQRYESKSNDLLQTIKDIKHLQAKLNQLEQSLAELESSVTDVRESIIVDLNNKKQLLLVELGLVQIELQEKIVAQKNLILSPALSLKNDIFINMDAQKNEFKKILASIAEEYPEVRQKEYLEHVYYQLFKNLNTIVFDKNPDVTNILNTFLDTHYEYLITPESLHKMTSESISFLIEISSRDDSKKIEKLFEPMIKHLKEGKKSGYDNLPNKLRADANEILGKQHGFFSIKIPKRAQDLCEAIINGNIIYLQSMVLESKHQRKINQKKNLADEPCTVNYDVTEKANQGSKKQKSFNNIHVWYSKALAAKRILNDLREDINSIIAIKADYQDRLKALKSNIEDLKNACDSVLPERKNQMIKEYKENREKYPTLIKYVDENHKNSKKNLASENEIKQLYHKFFKEEYNILTKKYNYHLANSSTKISYAHLILKQMQQANEQFVDEFSTFIKNNNDSSNGNEYLPRFAESLLENGAELSYSKSLSAHINHFTDGSMKFIISHHDFMQLSQSIIEYLVEEQSLPKAFKTMTEKDSVQIDKRYGWLLKQAEKCLKSSDSKKPNAADAIKFCSAVVNHDLVLLQILKEQALNASELKSATYYRQIL